jgi:hypothetical protein
MYVRESISLTRFGLFARSCHAFVYVIIHVSQLSPVWSDGIECVMDSSDFTDVLSSDSSLTNLCQSGCGFANNGQQHPEPTDKFYLCNYCQCVADDKGENCRPQTVGDLN